MQRVSSFLPSWDKRQSSGAPRTGSGLFGWGARSSSSPASSKTLAAVNAAKANGRIQREAFWPATLDLECDKAARILKSFCVDGYLHPVDPDAPEPPSDPSKPPSDPVKAIQKIPKRVIQNAAGIAVFTCMRSGLWMTGSGGSGILIARKSDGTWSPPSGIMLHTPTLSFIIGVDIYDCVLVVSNLAALEAITRTRVTLGEDVSLINGPSVPLDSLEKRISWKDLDNTVLAYMKARGQHQSVNLNGCILTERANENERFYNAPVTQMDVLAGNVSRHVQETEPLFEVIKMAEGRTDFDPAVIQRTGLQPAPGDALIETPRSTTPSSPRFGVPKADDPDPFGILALEMAGLEIREAGSRPRPTSSQVEFGNGPMSPAFSKFSRQSIESMARSNRASYMSNRTIKSQLTDAATQTNTRSSSPAPRDSDERSECLSLDKQDVDYTAVDMSALSHISQEYAKTPVIAEEPEELEVTTVSEENVKSATSPKSRSPLPEEDVESATPSTPEDDEDEFDDEDTDDDEEEPVVFEVAAVQPAQTQAVASRMIQARGNVVTIAKRVPPPLPRRSPARVSRLIKGEGTADTLSVKSPLRQAFSEADLRDEAPENSANGVADEAKSTGDVEESKLRRASDLGQISHSTHGEDENRSAGSHVDQAIFDDVQRKTPLPEIENGQSGDAGHAFAAAATLATDDPEKRLSAPEPQSPPSPASAAAKQSGISIPNKLQSAVAVVDDSDAAMDGDDEDVSDISDSELLEAAIIEPTTVRTMRLSQISATSGSKPQKLEIRSSREISAANKQASGSRVSSADDQLHSAMMAFNNLVQIEDSDSHPSTPHNEHTDASDCASTKKKHSSSIYTGATDDRWSYDGSSPTTPTSERPSSMSGGLTDEGTPKKRRKTKELEPVDHIEPLEPVDSHNGDDTPTVVSVA